MIQGERYIGNLLLDSSNPLVFAAFSEATLFRPKAREQTRTPFAGSDSSSLSPKVSRELTSLNQNSKPAVALA
jgi:hypothetical protein